VLKKSLCAKHTNITPNSCIHSVGSEIVGEVACKHVGIWVSLESRRMVGEYRHSSHASIAGVLMFAVQDADTELLRAVPHMSFTS
jgi:hypothetical protein